MWATALLAGAATLDGYFGDQWLTRTGGRSAAALAIADTCVNLKHQNAGTHGKAGAKIISTCDQYFQFRSESKRNQMSCVGANGREIAPT